MNLWTVWVDYGATGEGVTLIARIGYAESEQDALTRFERAFDPYYARGAEVAQGVMDNNVTRELFSGKTLQWVRQIEGRANVDLSGRLHYNFA